MTIKHILRNDEKGKLYSYDVYVKVYVKLIRGKKGIVKQKQWEIWYKNTFNIQHQ